MSLNADAVIKSPLKQPSSDTLANHLPSTTSIYSRKFVPNPILCLEQVDPALQFSVVTYNILAECHWSRGAIHHIPLQYMELGHRHSLLLKELDYLDGDIVCLQEVEPKYYVETLLPAMAIRGYSGCFMKRTQYYFDEGEATFVKKSKFDVISSEGFSLKDLMYKEVDEKGFSNEVNSAVKQYLDRADVMMLTQLVCLKTGKTVTVANIHVVYAPPCPDLQCLEIACAIKELLAQAGNDQSPHIICGDFNSEATSAVYQLAGDGWLSDDHIETLQALEALTNTDGSSQSLFHHMRGAFQHTSSSLRSAYKTVLGNEPHATASTSKQRCMDYLFFSSASLDVLGVLEMLDQAVLNNIGRLPSVNIPSDHLSLKAVFKMK